MILRRHFVLALVVFGLGQPVDPAVAQEKTITVFAAASMKNALDDINAAFLKATGTKVTASYAASSALARQIEQGAAFEMFLSADEELVYRLAGKGLTKDRGSLYAVGRIVLFVPEGSPLRPSSDLEGLRAALAARQIGHFAIANPEHAPYGRAAEQALRHAKLWESLQPHLVLGENVSQAAQFAVTGSSQGGIIAYSLVLAPSMKGRGTFALVPEDWHKPLRQRMALLRNATPAAERFYVYMQERTARDIMKRYGFVLPGE